MNRTLSNDIMLVSKHIYQSIYYREQGTFHKYNEKTGEYTFDKQEADKAKKALLRIAEALRK